MVVIVRRCNWQVFLFFLSNCCLTSLSFQPNNDWLIRCRHKSFLLTRNQCAEYTRFVCDIGFPRLNWPSSAFDGTFPEGVLDDSQSRQLVILLCTKLLYTFYLFLLTNPVCFIRVIYQLYKVFMAFTCAGTIYIFMVGVKRQLLLTRVHTAIYWLSGAYFCILQ